MKVASKQQPSMAIEKHHFMLSFCLKLKRKSEKACSTQLSPSNMAVAPLEEENIGLCSHATGKHW